MNSSRRETIKKGVTLLTGAGIGIPFGEQLFANTRKSAPSDTVNVALIGVRSRGFSVLINHLNLPDTKCVAICDVDENVLKSRAKELSEKFGQYPKQYSDYRKMLENKDIDAVIIGTPDHWHCLPYVHACQQGMDVYVEKPMANSIEECNIMVQAANKYNRVVQVGQQQRSSKHWQEIMEKIGSGSLGKLRKVEIWANFNYGIGSKIVPDEPVPTGVDYDYWLGPAPKRATFNTNRFHSNWRMWWDYGGGLMTDWGVHLVDMGLWAGGLKDDPTKVLAFGKNLSFSDHAHETFDTMSVTWPLQDYIMTWEHTAGTQNGPYDMPYGIRFICDQATILADRAGYRVLAAREEQKEEGIIQEQQYSRENTPFDLHARNFVDCIKDRKKTVCPPETGRQVALFTHMANIAVRTGEYMLDWDGEKNLFTNSTKANEYIVPAYRKPWKLPSL